MREERRLRVFNNTVLTWIFGPKKDKITAEWRRLHHKGFNALCFSLNTIRVINQRN